MERLLSANRFRSALADSTRLGGRKDIVLVSKLRFSLFSSILDSHYGLSADNNEICVVNSRPMFKTTSYDINELGSDFLSPIILFAPKTIGFFWGNYFHSTHFKMIFPLYAH